MMFTNIVSANVIYLSCNSARRVTTNSKLSHDTDIHLEYLNLNMYER